MRIFRFDEEVSHPVSEFGSRFKMGPLTGRESQEWVQIMHLTPGGLVGRHQGRPPVHSLRWWPGRFEEVRSHVWPAVKEVALRVDHIGSTAVPGLAAKRIINMDVVVASEKEVRPAIERLEAAGYHWLGDIGVLGREAFKQVRDHGLPPHHLYLVVDNSRAHQDHWLMRDLLRADPEAQDRYGRSQAAERGAGSQRHGGLRRRQGRIGCRTADEGEG